MKKQNSNLKKNLNPKAGSALILLFLFSSSILTAQHSEIIRVLSPNATFRPMENVVIVCLKTGVLLVRDSKGREYFRTTAATTVTVPIAGATGIHTARLMNAKGIIIDSAQFNVQTETSIDDGGQIGEMFRLFHQGMLVYDPDGVSEISWNGKTYRYFVEWVLDNNNTMKGMQYFSPYGAGLVDLLRENQQPNGMIWSFVRKGEDDYHYYETVYSDINYFKKDKDTWFVRQPVENHVEYNYVNMMYQHWKAGGDNNWMKNNLDCAMRALDYSVTDTVRWSKRFRLLKRPYCIDSWDFQVDDEYTPYAPVSPTMLVVPGKTKFGIFFGDNTGYYEACNQLSEMLQYAGMKDKASVYSQRAKEILERLNALSWNGRYYTHFIDEDPLVKRNLGVDEKLQIAQGNMYSINRGLTHGMDVSIIKTYLDLQKHLPAGSPGEWYAIYPPFEKGFGQHNQKWQYMNGGVAGHAAGELARGAFENGYEDYGSDILKKIYKLGKENGNRIWFAYTGSIPPPPPPPHYKSIDLSGMANMDFRDKGGRGAMPWMNTTRAGNDMRGIPTGDQVFNNIPFKVIDPENNKRKSVIGMSIIAGLPRQIEVPIGDSAATVYLLHSSSDNIPSTVAGAITFKYTDGTEASQYLMKGKDVTNWWFSSLENDYAGVAWWGPNLCSTKVGVCWAAVNNPNPSKKIDKLIFSAPLEGGIYALLGITLADRVHYVKPAVESFGGPDNWAASNAMAALVEGLAGVKNTGLAFDTVRLAPRWTSANVDSVNVTIQFAASKGYVTYNYIHDAKKKEIRFKVSGSGNTIQNHFLLPKDCQGVGSVEANGIPVDFTQSKIENSVYADFSLSLPTIHHVKIIYK
jgi:hypothetical protein